MTFLDSYGPAVAIKNRTGVLVRRVTGPDEVGLEHVRFQQMHRNVPVTAGEVAVRLRGTNVVSLTAKTLDVPENFDVTPEITAAQARAAAQALLAKYYRVADALLSRPRLEIFNRGILEGRVHPTRLAWFIEASALHVRQFIWVDARSGGILLSFNQLPHAMNRAVHNAASTSALPGPLARGEGQPTTGDTDTDLAYDFAGDTYNYFFTEHGRDSYDNAGATMTSTVHFCPDAGPCPYPNAYWDGSPGVLQVVYGNGFPAADDVVAHEWTHAVTQETANLYYYMQSGALNEAFSDIFGETVDLLNGKGNDAPEVRWKISEDATGVGAFRDMMDPTAFGNPGKMSDSQFVCNSGGSNSDDAGGVHSNSGLPNHAYALMVDGGSYNGFTITGIGLAKAGKIHYRALTQYLLSGSDFLDHYNAVKQSCLDLIGTFGITAEDYDNVVKALDAVEMAGTPCGQPAAPSLCPVGQTMSTSLFFDDFENGVANWGVIVEVGSNPWGWGDFFATSGTKHLATGPHSQRLDARVLMIPSVAIPAGGARMQFNHSFGFEDVTQNQNGQPIRIYYDGGVIEYSTDGINWQDAGSLITAGANYTGVITDTSDNPLANRNAFVGDSHGYVTTQLDLSTLAGQSVRFAFRISTDTGTSDYGWFIDDVRIYQCVDVNDPPVVTVPAGQTANEDVNLAITGISVADPDAASANVQITLSVTQGVLTLGSTIGLTFSTGDGTSDASMTFQGTLANLNSALTGLIYRGNLNFNGADTLTVTASDLGNTGVGGALTDSETVAITVNVVNDAPQFTGGANQTVAQNSGAQSTSGWATGMSAGPANESSQTLDFIVTNDKNYWFSGQPAVAANGTLTYTPALGMRGTAVVTVELHDTGGTANGGQNTSSLQTFNLTIGQSTDTEGDGLPDDWEQAYFNNSTSADASADSDGDGFTNLQEFQAGTDPTNPSSAIGITATEQVSNDMHVSFSTVAGKSYRVEYNDTSPSGPWSTLQNNVAGTGGVVQVLDAGGVSQLKRFYRVIVVSP